MENVAFANKRQPEPHPAFDLYGESYAFREARLQLRGHPTLWLKRDATEGFLWGSSAAKRYTHFYFRRPGTSAISLGAHVKDERTRQRLYAFRQSRFILPEDIESFRAWVWTSIPKLLRRLLPDLPDGAAARSLDQLLARDPWGRPQLWHRLYVSPMIRAFEQKPGIIVVDEAGADRYKRTLPQFGEPEFLTTKKSAPGVLRSTDLAFRIPFKKDFLSFMLMNFLEGDDSRIVLDEGGPMDSDAAPEVLEAGRWLERELDAAPDGPLYFAMRGDCAGRWLRTILLWALTGAMKTFQSLDMQAYWAGLRDQVRQARSLSDLDWARIFEVDFKALFGRNLATDQGKES